MNSLQELAAIKSLLPQQQQLGIGQLAQMAFQQQQQERQTGVDALNRQQILANIEGNQANRDIRKDLADREFAQNQQAFENLVAQQARDNALAQQAQGLNQQRFGLAQQQFQQQQGRQPLMNEHLLAQIALTQASAQKAQILNQMVAGSMQQPENDTVMQKLLEHFMGVAENNQ